MIHIVPTVPPAINGLADYCYKLWQHWPEPRPSWRCLALRIPPDAQEHWPQASLCTFEPTSDGLARALRESDEKIVVLHYVGYGYHPKGVPMWLPGALRAWKSQTAGARLYVMFHELWAQGGPLKSAFWLSPLARRIVVQLARDADGWLTSCEAAADKLINEAEAAAEQGRVVPIGPGIEPVGTVDFERIWPLSSGSRLHIAVFGLPLTRIKTLNTHVDLLREMCRLNMVERISLIGKASESGDKMLSELQAQIAPPAEHPTLWRSYGDLSPCKLSTLLLEHDLGLSYNSPSLLTKSSVFAALCSHGLVVVCGPETVVRGGAKHKFRVPHLSSDATNYKATLELLRDAKGIMNLKTEMRSATVNLLSWKGITETWAELTADGVQPAR